MFYITQSISIPEEELHFEFIRSTGPGGQNVNKVSTTVRLRFDAVHSPALPAMVRERLMQLAGQRMTENGVLVIEARRFRTQEMNRRDALERLAELIRRATEVPKERQETRPSRASQRRRLDSKRRQSTLKRSRRERHYEEG